MKVCILSSVHSALDNRVFYREARTLQRAGYDVTLVAVHDQDELKDGIEIVALPKVPRWQRPRLWKTLFDHALASQADVYHIHDPELLLVTPWLRLRTGKPTIYDVHEVYADFIKVKDYMPAWLRYPIAWTFRWLEPLLARLQSALIFSDDQIAASFARVQRPKATLFNFPSRQFIEDAVAATQNDGNRAPIVLYLGGLERNRGSQLMTDAFARIQQAMPAARLRIVGHFMPPELEQEVRADARLRGVEASICITGRVPFEEIGEHLAQTAVGWVTWQPEPKNEKNVPTKLFEYMAYGLPIVSSDLASTRPFVQDGVNGYRVAATDPQAHAVAILKILEDKEAQRAMGERGQAAVDSRFNWDEMESRLLALYEEVLS